MPGSEASEPDIMNLARTGDIPGMQKLFEAGILDATYTDAEGITPLHVRYCDQTKPCPSPQPR